ncbi:MAG: alpha/beta hydrolase [Anaerolineae bacterium]|jgi:pimeloyl-ACP methyl ester carboxylesterase
MANSAKRATWLILFLAVAAGLLAACGGPEGTEVSIPPGAEVGDLVLAPCTLSQAGVELAADCGVLVVPENRDNPGSWPIALPVRRFRAEGEAPVEPIFWFAGGPGNSNLNFWPGPGLLANHDVVLVGYRGIDGSRVLDCPEFSRVLRRSREGDLFSDASLDNLAAAAGACATRLQGEGVDLRGYNLAQVVADAEAVRQALGYERIDLLGGSFGTRVVQAYGYLHPEVVHRTAQLAPVVPGRAYFPAEEIDRILGLVADLCAQDEACSARSDDLAATMEAALEEMPGRWLIFRLDRGKVLMGTWGQLYDRGGMATVVDAYLAAGQGDYSGFWGLQIGSNLTWPEIWPWGAFFAHRFSAAYDPSVDYRDTIQPPGSILGSPANAPLVAAEAWPYEPIAEELRRVQPSAVETLFVAGELDVAAPAQAVVEEMLPAYAQGQLVLLPGMGHNDVQSGRQPQALAQLLVTFFDSGQGDSTGYVYEAFDFEPPRRWLPPSPLPARVKLIVAVGLAILLLPAGLFLLASRLVLRDGAPAKEKG